MQWIKITFKINIPISNWLFGRFQPVDSQTQKDIAPGEFKFYVKMCNTWVFLFSFKKNYIYIFVLTFLVLLENALIKKLVLISKLMMPEIGKQIITITVHILLNIPRSKGNQTWSVNITWELFFLKIMHQVHQNWA